jgi:hypothetical protein
MRCASRARAGSPAFDWGVPSPAYPVSMRNDSPAGVTISVDCPPSTSMK